MENAEINKKRKLVKSLIFAWILTAVLGGCVVSLNIQKNNSNSSQEVEQSQMATQKNDSTNFKLNVNEKEQQ